MSQSTKRTLLSVLLTFLIVLLLEAAGWFVFLYSGTYNISTYNHDTGPMNWVLDTGMTRSVARHAKQIKAPALDDPAMVQMGYNHFHEMCVSCHGAPGIRPEEIAQGLWPKAPDLAKTVPDWTPAQLFWITKNGIKFSAMPAWGPTHPDDEIWAVVAFLEKLPHLSPGDYHEMEQKSTGGTEHTGTTAGHQHAAARY